MHKFKCVAQTSLYNYISRGKNKFQLARKKQKKKYSTVDSKIAAVAAVKSTKKT